MVRKADIDKVWYHGDWEKTDFNKRAMDAEDYTRTRNALGPGIYWSEAAWQAKGYAGLHLEGFLYTANMKLDPKRVMTVRNKSTREIVTKFLDLAPDESRETGLSNWEDDREAAIDAYAERLNLLDALAMVYNDFYGMDSKAYAAAMVKIGYDAYLQHFEELDNLIVWNPAVIEVTKVEPALKHIDEYDSFKY